MGISRLLIDIGYPMGFGEKSARQNLFLLVNTEFAVHLHSAYWVQPVVLAITCAMAPIAQIAS